MSIFGRLGRPDIAGLFARKDMNALVSALQQQDLRTRWEALLALDDGTIHPMAWGEIAAAFLKDPESVPILRELLAHPPVFCSSTGVLGLLWSTATKYPEEAKPAIAQLTASICALLNAENSLVREFAAKVLEFGGDPQAVEPLVKALGDPHDDVRSAATSALGSIGGAKVVDVLGNIFQQKLHEHQKNPNDNGYQSAAEALGKTKDPKAAEALAAAMQTADDWEIKHIEKALVLIGDPVFDLALNILISGSTRNKCVAAGILGEIKDPRGVDPLIKALGDNASHVWYGGRVIGGQLESRVCECARRALERIGNPAREALTAAVQRGAPGAKLARKVLAGLGT
jgi:HEAT repeat protein